MKLSPTFSRVLAGACLLPVACPLALGQLTSSIGTRHFDDGQIIGTGDYITAVSGQTAPFNQFRGSDASGSNFSAEWMMDFIAPASFSSATLTFGIFDHDSSATSTPVAFFSAGGVDLTSTLNSIMTAHGGANGEYNVYTINLPASTHTALLGGSIQFQLGLNAPGLSVFGNSAFNGAGLDFADLYVAIPEPATEAWFAVAAAASLLGVHFHRRRNR